MCVDIYVCVCIYMYVHVYMCICVCVYIFIPHIYWKPFKGIHPPPFLSPSQHSLEHLVGMHSVSAILFLNLQQS